MKNWIAQGSSVIRISRLAEALSLGVSLAEKPRGHKQRKLNDDVYSFILLVSCKPHF